MVPPFGTGYACKKSFFSLQAKSLIDSPACCVQFWNSVLNSCLTTVKPFKETTLYAVITPHADWVEFFEM